MTYSYSTDLIDGDLINADFYDTQFKAIEVEFAAQAVAINGSIKITGALPSGKGDFAYPVLGLANKMFSWDASGNPVFTSYTQFVADVNAAGATQISAVNSAGATQIGLAAAQVTLATAEKNAAVAAKDLALGYRDTAQGHASSASGSASAASSSASSASGSASTATTQAGVATTQAGIATTKAAEAAGAEVEKV